MKMIMIDSPRETKHSTSHGSNACFFKSTIKNKSMFSWECWTGHHLGARWTTRLGSAKKVLAGQHQCLLIWSGGLRISDRWKDLGKAFAHQARLKKMLQTKTGGSIRHELVVGRTTALIGALSVVALSVLTRLRRLALVYVRAIEARHHWKNHILDLNNLLYLHKQVRV